MAKKYKVIPIYNSESSKIPITYIPIKKYRNTRNKPFLVVNFKDHKVSANSTKLKVYMNKYSRKTYIKRIIDNILFKL